MAWDKVSSGQQIKQTPIHRAGFINDTIDVVNDYKAGKRPPHGPDTHGVDTNEVQVRNKTCGDRLRGEVVQLGAPLVGSPPDHPYHPWFEGRTVAAPADKRWAILRLPLKECEIGPALIAGRALAWVMVTSLAHTHAIPVIGSPTLTSATSGNIEILSPPASTGLQEIWVRLAVPADASTATTTTTTPEPSPLAGNPCKWTWDETGNKWTLEDDADCPSATTTTTTTEEPCACSTTTTSPDPSGTTTTTTTPEPEFTCQYPTFCGDEDGQCTYTTCVRIDGEEPSPPECTTSTTTTTQDPETTTTPDPETTTTTFDCNSTTTTDPMAGCNSSCMWVGDPVSGTWALVSGCGSSLDCAGRNVCGGCAYPSGAVDICSSVTTDCVPLSPPVQPGPPPPCGGGHSYICGIDNAWHYVGGTCNGGGGCKGCPNCYGIYPWYTPNCGAGPAPSGSCMCGASTFVPCRSGPCSPCSSESPGYDPCATTTTEDPGSTTTTTTTADPCGTGCKWQAAGGYWTNEEDNCLGDCHCSYPGFAPHDDCEVARTPCIDLPPPPTTTTTTSQPTTTESPTTTTTPGPTTTTTTTSTTTTTTTPEPYYCCGEIGGDCFGTVSCVQGGPCEFGEPGRPNCGGGYPTLEECEAACASVTTTTTTTCDPEADCDSMQCIMICPFVVDPKWGAPLWAFGPPCVCEPTPEQTAMIGEPCGPAGSAMGVNACNPCPGSTEPCGTTTTTPAP